MVTRFEAQEVRRELLEWCRHHTPPVQLCCINIALNLARLASEPDDLKLRRETTGRIASLEEAVLSQAENAASALGSVGELCRSASRAFVNSRGQRRVAKSSP